jgi:predicted ABC-type ATPase
MNKESQTLLNYKIIRTSMDMLKIHTYDQVSKFLKAATENMLRDFEKGPIQTVCENKILYMIAGPNGSGKSTVISYLCDQRICPPYYICPDYLVEDGGRDALSYIKAMKKASELRLEGIQKGFSFIMETVFSSDRKQGFLFEARERGYTIFVIYIITSSYNINIERVALRVSQGGHDVSTDKIIERYKRCLDIMPKVIDFADYALVYDNSEYQKIPRLVQSKENNYSDTI